MESSQNKIKKCSIIYTFQHKILKILTLVNILVQLFSFYKVQEKRLIFWFIAPQELVEVQQL